MDVSSLKRKITFLYRMSMVQEPIASSLVRLELHGSDSDNVLDNILSNSKHSLEHLGLWIWSSQIRSNIAMILAKCTRLRSLALCCKPWHTRFYEHMSLQVQEMLQACPNLRALDFDLGDYPDLRWLPNTIETLQITASFSFTTAHWLSFLEEQGDVLALREISINFPIHEPNCVIHSSSRWWRKADELKRAFERRGIRVSGAIIERWNQHQECQDIPSF
jgi:hypothetical protein